MEHATALACALVVFGAALTTARQGGKEAYTRETYPVLRGAYLGQNPPGRVAERFAPGIVSTPALDSVPTFSPDGREMYWSRIGPDRGIYVSRVENGVWTFPEKLPVSHGDSLDVMPVVFSGGRRLLFLSTRPLPDGRRPQKGFFTFWITVREGRNWGPPTPIQSVFSGTDDFSAMAEDGTLYLSAGSVRSISRVARSGDGRYTTPEALKPPIEGLAAYVARDERYLIFGSTRTGGLGASDLFISFRSADGTWSAPANLGPAVNSPAYEQFASLSPDGKYLFFCSDRGGDFDVWWIDAGVIDHVKQAYRQTPADR